MQAALSPPASYGTSSEGARAIAIAPRLCRDVQHQSVADITGLSDVAHTPPEMASYRFHPASTLAQPSCADQCWRLWESEPCRPVVYLQRLQLRRPAW